MSEDGGELSANPMKGKGNFVILGNDPKWNSF